MHMRYCMQCGTAMRDDAPYCTECGSRQAMPTDSTHTDNGIKDSGSFAWFLVGFFIPFVGFILWLAWMGVKPKCSKMAGYGVLTLVLLVLIVFALLLSGVGSPDSGTVSILFP